MNKKEEYLNHIKESWEFSTNIANKTNAEMKSKLALLIFDKVCSPYHYFLQNIEPDEEQPTEKQIKYAKNLDIDKPEKYSKKELSKKIDEVVKNG